MIEYLSSAITNLKAAKDTITTIQSLRDSAKINEATTELRECLIEVGDRVFASQEQVLSLQAKISNLEKENNHLKDWSLEKVNYK